MARKKKAPRKWSPKDWKPEDLGPRDREVTPEDAAALSAFLQVNRATVEKAVKARKRAKKKP